MALYRDRFNIIEKSSENFGNVNMNTQDNINVNVSGNGSGGCSGSGGSVGNLNDDGLYFTD